MVGFNRVMLMGNLTRDPQVKTLPNQTVLAEFGLACNRKFKTADGEDRQDTTFVDCTAFGRQAEVIAEFCQKGKALFIEGRLKYDSWEDKNGGGKRSKLSIVVENFQFVGGRDDSPAAAAPGADGGKAQDWAPSEQPAAVGGSHLRGQPSGGEARTRPQGRRREPAAAGFKQSDIPF